ncbi:hypothetical protein JGI13_00600 [Candidatus Kryptonium thompsonii]|nr:hypothetical protein JGI13_00600 [Candidatus Kryptonium thompsoni]CUS84109.1 hypothetical protein JGI10_00977 [Candidatus Kryptonium thompsoni]
MFLPGFRLYFSLFNKYTKLDPRVSIKYLLNSYTSLQFSFGTYSQYLNRLETEIEAPGSDDYFIFPETFTLWRVADNKKLQPSKATHYVFTLKTKLTDEIDFTSGVYYKDFQRVYIIYYSSSEGYSGSLKEGKKKSYGVEFLLEKRIGKITGWLSYTLSKVINWFPGVNQGKPYPPKYDRRHNFHIVAQYNLSPKWKFNLEWRYYSGVPYTPYGGGDKNSKRTPAYHRLDVGIIYTFKVKERWRFNLYLQIYNLYNNKNIIEVYYSKSSVNYIYSLPFLPTAGIEIEFK